MLTIRRNQLKELADQRRRDFERRLFGFLSVELRQTGVVVVDSVLRRRISNGVGRAAWCKLTRECDVARFVEIVCSTVGAVEVVWESDEALAILFDHRFGEESKLARFSEWAMRQVSRPVGPVER